MKYVILEHRLTSPYTKFDTNDSVFEIEAYKLQNQRYSEREKVKNQIIGEINHVVDQAQQNKQDLDELRKNTSNLTRLFSKEYRTEQTHLQNQQEYQIQHLKLIKEVEEITDDNLYSFDTYNDLKQLLKDNGYVLVNKTTNDRYNTTEIWHKND